MKEWKKYKIGDVFAYLKSGKGIHANEISSKGEYPVYVVMGWEAILLETTLKVIVL